MIPDIHILGTVMRTEQFGFTGGQGAKLFFEVMARRTTRDGGSYDEPLVYEIAAYGEQRIGDLLNLQPGTHLSIHCELRSKKSNTGDRWFMNLAFKGISPQQQQGMAAPAPQYGTPPPQHVQQPVQGYHPVNAHGGAPPPPPPAYQPAPQPQPGPALGQPPPPMQPPPYQAPGEVVDDVPF